MISKVEYWLDIADYDLKTAISTYKSSKYLYTVFLCQQTIEKRLKAIYIEKKDADPPYTHNLIFLVNKIEIVLTKSDMELIAKLSSFYIESRYPSYKNKLSKLINKAKALDILNKTKRLVKCLKAK